MSNTKMRVILDALNDYVGHVDEAVVALKAAITDHLDEDRLDDVAPGIVSLRKAFLIRRLTVELLTAAPDGDTFSISDAHLARFLTLGDLPGIYMGLEIVGQLHKELHPLWRRLAMAAAPAMPEAAAPEEQTETLEVALARADRANQPGAPDAG